MRLHTRATPTGATPYTPRSPGQITAFFWGLEPEEPGIVSLSQWPRDPIDMGSPAAVDAYGGVARKP
ncbi:MAG: SAM-dependent methyltransferase [Pseudonocardia sp.]|nr:SAM-dependent methyltransferase [Pseudonocardia sp.]